MKDRAKTTTGQKMRNFMLFNGRRAALVVAGLVIGFGMAMPQDSLAKHKHRHHGKKVHVRHGHPVHRQMVRPPFRMPNRMHFRGDRFAVPHRIAVRTEVNRYRPYFNRRVYYAPHRHHHNVYDFPVAYRDGWVARPYAYCNGQLHGGLRLSYSRPGLSVAVGW